MNGTEKMQGTAESTAARHPDDEFVGAAESSATDQRRRRLVRGAAAAVPVILTLRSGALAAASCTGAVAVDVETNKHARLPDGTYDGKYCASNVSTSACTGNKIQATDRTAIVPVVQVVENNRTKYFCGQKDQHGFREQYVAILSSASATSISG